MIKILCISLLVLLCGIIPLSFGEDAEEICNQAVDYEQCLFENWVMMYDADEICKQALYYDEIYGVYTEFDVTDYEMSTGDFVALCYDDEYGSFDIFLSVDQPGTLTMTVSKEPFDLMERFDYIKSCSYDEYTVNGRTTGSHNAGITASQLSQTDSSRTIQFTWDKPVHQISYSFNSVLCIQGHNDLGLDPSEPFPTRKPTSYSQAKIDRLAYCPPSYVVYLNHTIVNATLSHFCASYGTVIFQINAFDDGYIVLDLPNAFLRHDKPFNIYVRSLNTILNVDYSRPYPPVYKSVDDPVADEINKSLQITRLGTYDTFKRYHIPFLKGDNFHNLGQLVQTMIYDMTDILAKYQTPIENIPTSQYDIPMEIMSPKKQFESGITLENIQCREFKILMQSPRNLPACINESSVDSLIDRGFIRILQTNLG